MLYPAGFIKLVDWAVEFPSFRFLINAADMFTFLTI